MMRKIVKKYRFDLTIGILLLVGALGYLGISFYIVTVLTNSAPNPTDDTPSFVSPAVSQIAFSAADGLQLHGWLYPNKLTDDNKRLIIFVSGFEQNRSSDDYYGLFIAHDLYQKGYSILLFDPRESGTPATRKDFGQTRGNDVLGAVHFAERIGYIPKHIGIIADSLGTVATLMVVDKLSTIGPIVIDSGIARMRPLLELRMSKDDHIPSFLFPGIFFMAKTFYHLDIGTINPIEYVAKVPHRIFLFLAGSKDSYVPLENSQELLKTANPESNLVIFPSATHVHTYRSDPNLYNRTVDTFFSHYFSR